MHKTFIIIILSFISAYSYSQADTVIHKADIRLPVFSFSGFETLLNQKNDTTYVVNFWATWCAPCVKEMPYFEKLQDKYKDQKVKVIFVSLDFADNINNRVIPFLEAKKLKSKVILLDEPKAHKWIPKINENWSGAIPATLIYKADKSVFYEQSLTYDELKDAVLEFIP